MFSILGGQWRGRKLKAMDRDGLRPTSSRVKASIFNILDSILLKRSGQAEFSDWHCLDLFAGVGGLGLEMLSRGAAHCVFVEKERTHAQLLKENIGTLDCAGQCRVILDDVQRGEWEKYGPYNLILLDPPYAESQLTTLLFRFVKENVLKPGGIVLFEHDPKVNQGEVAGLSLHSTRIVGPAGITVYLRDP